MAYLVGPVVVHYGEKPARPEIADLPRFIDRKKQVVRSATGQLAWDYGRGVCTLNAPAAQGATGFLKKVGPVTLGDLTIRCENDYATILAVSLDDRPIARSGRGAVRDYLEGYVYGPPTWSDYLDLFGGERMAVMAKQARELTR